MADKQHERDPQAEQAGQDAQSASTHRPAAEEEVSGQPVPLSPEAKFPIVGLGASAGGLEALEDFFRHMPADSGMAFVVVTHQPASHTSLLPDLLRKHTGMPVQEVTAGVRVEPDHIYLSQPGLHLALIHTVLQPMHADDSHTSLQFPIDYFFRTLAEDQKEHAICIILSGTGTDGTLGLQAVKGVGGMCMAQSEQSARFPGMPNSAIATGLVDYILTAEQLPEALLSFVQGPYVQGEVVPSRTGSFTDDYLRQLYVLLRNYTKHDFSVYKTSTLRRRIERRMNVQQIQAADRYLAFLREHSYERDLLFQELLIGVTSFFRDPEAFEVLATQALPELLATRADTQTIRVWVPGCSTGEEAYSLAILLREGLERLDKQCPVQIFATDLSGPAIEKARTGLFPDGIAIDVRPERLERYFLKEEGGYRIRKGIREMVIFAQQDLLTDPPFTKLDLLSCRNLLIYLEASVQKQLVPLFHYVLNPGGLLFLGSSESVGSSSELFTVIDKRWKVFQRKESVVSQPLMEFPVGSLRPDRSEEVIAGLSKQSSPALSDLVGRLLLQQFAPPSVVVSENGDIVYIHGQTGLFLQPAPGPPSLNIFAMAREGLRVDLTAAVRRAVSQDTPVIHRGVQIKTNGGSATIDLGVQRLADPEPLRGLYLVTLQADEPVRSARAKRKRHSSLPQDERVAELEHEVQALRETLQSTVEEANTANEELQSTNEELQSTNEELQSSNEELETAKEEMQSLNEELQTVNSELQSKVEDLSQTNDDMQNLLNSTDIATLFLDNDFRIKRFTSQATQMIKLIASDVGRPIGDLVTNLVYDNLEADAHEVLRTLSSKEVEMASSEGTWYRMRIMPYRTAENVIDGLVITFINISGQKQAQQVSRDALLYVETLVETVWEPLVVLDADLHVASANRAFYRLFHMREEDTVGSLFYELGNGGWNSEPFHQLLEAVQNQRPSITGFELTHRFPGSSEKTLSFNARRIEREEQPALILLAMQEVSPH